MDQGQEAITGHVRTGEGRATGFTALPWVARQFRGRLGIEPHPGTLNLAVPPGARGRWRAWSARPGIRLEPEDPAACAARCHPVRVHAPGRNPVTAAVIVPEVAGYDPDRLELVAAVGLRDALEARDGDELVVEPAAGRRCRAVLFDVDGTLVNSIEGYRLAAERAVSPYGWTVSAEAVSRTMNFGESFWDLVLPPERRGDEALIARLRAEILGHWPDILAASVLVDAGIGPLLARLRAAGLRLGICTASRGESFRPLEQAGLLEFFDVVVTARDVRATKPDPEGLHLCLDRLGIPATEAAYVGDTVTDMRASHAAGLFAVGVLTGAGTSSLLSAAGAHRILPGLEDLPGLLGVALSGTG